MIRVPFCFLRPWPVRPRSARHAIYIKSTCHSHHEYDALHYGCDMSCLQATRCKTTLYHLVLQLAQYLWGFSIDNHYNTQTAKSPCIVTSIDELQRKLAISYVKFEKSTISHTANSRRHIHSIANSLPTRTRQNAFFYLCS